MALELDWTNAEVLKLAEQFSSAWEQPQPALAPLAAGITALDGDTHRRMASAADQIFGDLGSTGDYSKLAGYGQRLGLNRRMFDRALKGRRTKGAGSLAARIGSKSGIKSAGSLAARIGAAGGRTVGQYVSPDDSAGIRRIMYALRTVESGGNYQIYNQAGSGAAGAYQYMPGTWGGYGGYRSAAQAPSWVQDAKAYADIRAALIRYDGNVKYAVESWLYPAQVGNDTFRPGNNPSLGEYWQKVAGYL